MPSQRGAQEHIQWEDVFCHLTDRSNQSVDRDTLRTHLKYRYFAPDDPKAIDSLIDDAVTSDILNQRADGSLGYNGAFDTISLDIGGKVYIDIKPQ